MKDTIEIVRQFLKEESFVSDTDEATLDSIIKSLNDSQKHLSTRTTHVKRIIDEMGGTLEDKKVFERVYDKLDDVIDTLDKIKKQIA